MIGPHLTAQQAIGKAVWTSVVAAVRPSRRTLRVRLAAGDRLLLERHVGRDGVLRVGSHTHDDVVLPVAEVGEVRLTMQVDAAGNAQIDVPSGLPLQLGRGGTVLDTAAARAAGQLVDVGGRQRLTLAVGDLARLDIGGYRLLLQLADEQVAPAVVMPKLPRRGLVSVMESDPVWWASLSIATLAVCLLVGQALVYQREVGQFLRPAQEELALEETYPIEIAVVAPPTPEPEPSTDEPPLQPPTPTPPSKPEPSKPAPSAKRNAPAPSGKERTADAASPAQKVADVLQRRTIIGAVLPSSGASGLFAVDDAAEAATHAVAFGASGGQGDDGPGLPGGQDLRLDGVGNEPVAQIHSAPARTLQREGKVAVARAKAPEKLVVVTIQTPHGPGEPSGPRVRVAALSAKIRRCYEAALRQNANLSGKLQVVALLGMAGRFETVQVLGFGPPISDCVESALLGTRGLPVVERPTTLKMAFVLRPGT